MAPCSTRLELEFWREHCPSDNLGEVLKLMCQFVPLIEIRSYIILQHILYPIQRTIISRSKQLYHLSQISESFRADFVELVLNVVD